MIKVFLGSREKALRAAQEFLNASVSQKDSVISFGENAAVEDIAALTENRSLFGEAVAVKLDQVLANDLLKEYILAHLKDFSSSLNVFALLEEKIAAESLVPFKEEGIEIVRSLSDTKGKPEFTIFALSDALSVRDKRTLWVRYTEAKNTGESPEAMAGVLFWQLKTILLAAKDDTKDLNPFVASKAKNALRKFKPEEVQDYAFRLLSVYHEAHRGKQTLDEALERLILSV